MIWLRRGQHRGRRRHSGVPLHAVLLPGARCSPEVKSAVIPGRVSSKVDRLSSGAEPISRTGAEPSTVLDFPHADARPARF
jgi:hypothetical protein